MKNLNRIFLSVIGLTIMLMLTNSCKTPHIPTTTVRTIYLQEAEVTGPINQPPIHITDSIDTPSITFSPRFSYSTKNTLIGDIKQRSELYELDTTFVPSENSLTWNIATVNAGLDMDVVLSKSFAIFLE